MTTAKFKYGTSSKLANMPIEEGTFYVLTDTDTIAVDIDGDRHNIGSSGGTNLELPLPITSGGSGETTAEGAWKAFGGGSVGKLNLNNSANNFLNGNGTWSVPKDTTYDPVSDSKPGLMTVEQKKKLDSIEEGATKNQDYKVFTRNSDGLVPQSGGTTSTRYLREDGSWETPPDSDTRVMQNPSTTNANYPILGKMNTDANSSLGGVYFNTNMTANPSTGTITASTFKGTLDGNAATATKASSADSATTANSASKLTSAVNIGVKNGNAAAATASFDGSKAVTITVNNLDASTLTTGTVPIERLPQGALERLVHVANQAARFKLTTDTVQLGDTVQQDDTGIMYIVVDESKLSSAAGYTEYVAGTAAKAASADTAALATKATSADQLTNSRNLGVALGTSNNTGASFNGSANQLSIPVSGTLGIGNGGTGATTKDAAWTNLGGGSVGKLNTNGSSANYLRGDGTWVTPPNTTYNVATTTTNGLMSSNDKAKLNYTNIAYCICSTAAGTAAKEVTVVDNNNWELQTGSIIGVAFTNTNSASNVTLNVNGTGAKGIWYSTGVYTSTSGTVCGSANRMIFYMFDGTYWRWVSHGSEDNTTYTNMTLGNGYGTCATVAATTAKTATLANYSLLLGGYVSIKFTYDVPAGSTLNVNSKGAKPMWYWGAPITDGVIKAGDLATFIYDGTNYQLTSIDYNQFGGSNPGLVPSSNGGTANFLRADGQWATPPNTNTYVTQNNSTAATAYPILLKNGTGTGAVTSTANFSSTVTLTPSTGTITATTFKGALDGNAATATTASTCTGNAATATSAATLTTSRNLGVALGTSNTTGAAFNGGSNQLAIPVSGTLGIGNGGTGATTADAAWTALGGGDIGKLNKGTSTTTYLRNDGSWATPTNTDTKVTQTVTTTSAEYPILAKNTNATATITDSARFGAGITLNPSTKTITATTFKGDLDGNAKTATQANVAYATCTTAAATAAKEATIQGNDGWTLQVGSIVVVKSTNTSTASNCTLNVNGTGAKQIWYNNAVYTSTSNMVTGYANRSITYMYDGTYWVWLSYGTDANTTYTNVSLGQGYGTCTTAEATAEKAVTLASYALTVGGIVVVNFTNAVPANAKLNVNTKGAKPIFFNGKAIVADIIAAGDTATFIYNGTNYYLLSVDKGNFSGSTPGYVPSSAGGTANYLRADGTWSTPPNTNTDTKVTETVATDNAEYPILTKNTTATATITDTSKFAAGVTINPSTKTITATTFKGALTGNVTGNVSGSSGSCTGNAATATSAGKWTSAKTLGGISVDGSANRHWFATCPTAAATAAKVATVEDSQTFTLAKGAMVFVKFTYANGVASPTLNVNNTGAKNIYRYGTTAPSTSAATSWQANSVVCLVYDGSYWQMVGWLNDNTNTWTAFKGATATAAGTAGYAPQPKAGDQNKFFRGDGTWSDVGDIVYIGSTEPKDANTRIWIVP